MASNSLAAFLDVMYKKRELEYRAAADQAKYDVLGAQAIGEGIGTIGKGLGSIMSTYNTQQDKMALDKLSQGLQTQAGITPLSTGMRPGMGAAELELRDKMGQFENRQMTPYQSASIDLALQREDRRERSELAKQAQAANREASDKLKQSQSDALAYQKNTSANMRNLFGARTEDEFNQARDLQLSWNAAASSQPWSKNVDIPQVPTRYIPPAQQPAYDLYNYQRQFSQGTTDPRMMREKVANAGGMSVGGGPGQLPPPTTQQVPTTMYPTGQVPQGAIPARGFPGKPGTEAEMDGKRYRFDGNFWVPAQ